MQRLRISTRFSKWEKITFFLRPLETNMTVFIHFVKFGPWIHQVHAVFAWSSKMKWSCMLLFSTRVQLCSILKFIAITDRKPVVSARGFNGQCPVCSLSSPPGIRQDFMTSGVNKVRALTAWWMSWHWGRHLARLARHWQEHTVSKNVPQWWLAHIQLKYLPGLRVCRWHFPYSSSILSHINTLYQNWLACHWLCVYDWQQS